MWLGFNYQSNFLFFFALQGLIFSLLLWRQGRKEEQVAPKWLAGFLVLSSLYLAPWMLGHLGWYGKDGLREFLFFMPFHQLFLMGPVIYFYQKSLLNPSFQFARRDWLHYVPAILYFGYSVTVYVVDEWVLTEYWFYADGRDKDLVPWYQISGLASMLGYAILSIREYRTYRGEIVESVSYADSVLHHWVQQFLIAFILILGVRLFFLILLPEWGDFGKKWWHYLCFGLVTYYIGLNGYRNTLRMAWLPAPLAPVSPPQAPPLEPPAPAPTGNGVSSAELEEGKSNLRQFIESEKGYAHPGLTLQDVAQRLQLTPKQVSALINQVFQMNFNDFVNQFRVAAIKERLEKGEHYQFTLLAIALDCGFNSKATFNRVFKKWTGKTPGQYVSQLRPK
ncbi:MAG: AraC family transcriptional regulator [Bacteroidota bacterium]